MEDRLAAALRAAERLFPPDRARLAAHPSLPPWEAGRDASVPPLQIAGEMFSDPLYALAHLAHPAPVERLQLGGEWLPFARAAAALNGRGPPGPCPVEAVGVAGGVLVPRRPGAWSDWAFVRLAPDEGAAAPAPVLQVCEGVPVAPSGASQHLGAAGEQWVRAVLAEHFDVVAVGSVARSGDIHLRVRGGTLLVEVKNYATPVPRAESQKFMRDLAASGAAAGVLLSLASPVTGTPSVLHASLEALPETPGLVPVVVAAPPARAGALAPQLLLAAVRLAAFLLGQEAARGTPHAERRAEKRARGVEEGARLAADTAGDLRQLAATCSEALAGACTKLMVATRDLRGHARALRAPSAGPGDAGGEWGRLCARYPLAEPALTRGLVEAAGEGEWKLLAQKARHPGGLELTFRKAQTLAGLPAARLTEQERSVFLQGGKNVSLADGVLCVVVCDAAADLLERLKALL